MWNSLFLPAFNPVIKVTSVIKVIDNDDCFFCKWKMIFVKNANTAFVYATRMHNFKTLLSIENKYFSKTNNYISI